MRTVKFSVDDYGNLCRYVETESLYFCYPALHKKELDLVMAAGIYDEWGGLKEKSYDQGVKDGFQTILQIIKELRPAIKPLEGMGKGKTAHEWFDILVKHIEEKNA